VTTSAPGSSRAAIDQPSPPLRLDLTLLPAGERFPFWQEQGSRVLRPLPTWQEPQAPPMVRSDVLQLRRVSLARMEASAQEFERTATMVRADGSDHYWLVLLETGSASHAVSESVLHLCSGDLLLIDASRPCRSRWSDHHQIFASFPREVLERSGPSPVIPGRLAASHPHGRLLAAPLRGVWSEALGASPMTRTALGEGLTCLTRCYFNAVSTVEAHSSVEAPGQELLGTMIRRWLKGQLHRRDLNATTIAAEFHISRSSLYRLFAPWGGVRSYLQEQRLRVAVEQLQQHAGPIAPLADTLGFASASAFSHAFRNRWGVAPREWQRQPRGWSGHGHRAMDRAVDHNSPQARLLGEGVDRYYMGLKGMGPKGREGG